MGGWEKIKSNRLGSKTDGETREKIHTKEWNNKEAPTINVPNVLNVPDRTNGTSRTTTLESLSKRSNLDLKIKRFVKEKSSNSRIKTVS